MSLDKEKSAEGEKEWVPFQLYLHFVNQSPEKTSGPMIMVLLRGQGATSAAYRQLRQRPYKLRFGGQVLMRIRREIQSTQLSSGFRNLQVLDNVPSRSYRGTVLTPLPRGCPARADARLPSLAPPTGPHSQPGGPGPGETEALASPGVPVSLRAGSVPGPHPGPLLSRSTSPPPPAPPGLVLRPRLRQGPGIAGRGKARSWVARPVRPRECAASRSRALAPPEPRSQACRSAAGRGASRWETSRPGGLQGSGRLRGLGVGWPGREDSALHPKELKPRPTEGTASAFFLFGPVAVLSGPEGHRPALEWESGPFGVPGRANLPGSPFRLPAGQGPAVTFSRPLNRKRLALARTPHVRICISHPGRTSLLLPGQSCNPKPGVPVLGGGLLHTERCFKSCKRGTQKS
ncbi:translation initiation factor IF-2-like [Cebus imitator]|uniref:translation initiation factor IF-2-like n=1 Tax=Cebus imitator TaxID=2715852 RepID=UPI00189790A1|nr:translation initiation factor IF-2-like [Cebus imitator]